VEYDSKFRLYLQTKLANPHYKPEIAAQTTLVNFCVTEKVGLLPPSPPPPIPPINAGTEVLVTDS
jgi:hypothetical protein